MNHLWRLVIFSLLQPLHSLAPKVRSYGFARALATCRVQSPQLIWVCKATTSLKTSKVQLFANTKGVSSNWNEARYLVSQGMESFRRGRVTESVDLFDQADSLVPDGSLHPYLWQRGISLYYVNRLQDASDQFRSDVKVNPNDVEEIVWDIAAQLRLRPSDFPVSTQMTLPPGARERNKVMVRTFVWTLKYCNLLTAKKFFREKEISKPAALRIADGSIQTVSWRRN